MCDTEQAMKAAQAAQMYTSGGGCVAYKTHLIPADVYADIERLAAQVAALTADCDMHNADYNKVHTAWVNDEKRIDELTAERDAALNYKGGIIDALKVAEAMRKERDAAREHVDLERRKYEGMFRERIQATKERDDALEAVKIAWYLLSFNPRVEKLARKGKPFLVIAVDEPYFRDVYERLRGEEIDKRTWTEEDQELMNQLLDEHDAALQAREDN